MLKKFNIPSIDDMKKSDDKVVEVIFANYTTSLIIAHVNIRPLHTILWTCLSTTVDQFAGYSCRYMCFTELTMETLLYILYIYINTNILTVLAVKRFDTM